MTSIIFPSLYFLTTVPANYLFSLYGNPVEALTIAATTLRWCSQCSRGAILAPSGDSLPREHCGTVQVVEAAEECEKMIPLRPLRWYLISFSCREIHGSSISSLSRQHFAPFSGIPVRERHQAAPLSLSRQDQRRIKAVSHSQVSSSPSGAYAPSLKNLSTRRVCEARPYTGCSVCIPWISVFGGYVFASQQRQLDRLKLFLSLLTSQ